MIKKSSLNNSAQYVKGVGPKRMRLLSNLGIESIKDLLYLFPRRYDDRTNLKSIKDFQIGEMATIQGTVKSVSLFRTARKHKILLQVAVNDGSATIHATWFNQPYMKNYFKKGDQVVMYGKVQQYQNRVLVAPEFEIISGGDKEEANLHMNRIVPVYPLTAGLNQRALRTILYRSLEDHIFQVEDMLPTSIRVRYKLIDLKSALKTIHFPKDIEYLTQSRRRLIFDEFFIFQLALAVAKHKIKKKKSGIVHDLKGELTEKFIENLPFELTNAQKRSIEEIGKDLSENEPMYRLLQGDVGSGKTIVALWALVVAIQNGYQAALMVPTEILANQHFHNIKKFVNGLGIQVEILTSSVKGKDREQVVKDIAEGKAKLIIGTHALIQEAVKYKNLALVVVDEQHKFGVDQRAALMSKGMSVDLLVMTATPIPRTLAMTAYGDLDISTIDEMPAGRKPIKTSWYGNDKIKEAHEFIKKRLDQGRQVYIVYPLVTESDNLDLKDATKMCKKLQAGPFKKYKLALIHGKLKGDEKKQIMADFHDKKIDVLVSTVVVEVGLDVPNACVMVIEHAERFGLSQLHQLRGRIGRGEYESSCILLADDPGEEAMMRIESMVELQDGFKIAERDLELRGPGEMLGTRQHGVPKLKIANLLDDMKALEAARKEAFELIKVDANLTDPRYALLKEEVKRVLSGRIIHS